MAQREKGKKVEKESERKKKYVDSEKSVNDLQNKKKTLRT